jgi:hypothetical protein
MPIRRLTHGGPFEPEEIRLMTAAFEDACRILGLEDPTNSQRDIVAQKIIEAALAGERDPARLRACGVTAVKEGN